MGKIRIRFLPDWALWLGLGASATSSLLAAWAIAKARFRYLSKLQIEERDVQFEIDDVKLEIRVRMTGTVLHVRGDEPCFVFAIFYEPSNSSIAKKFIFPPHFELPSELQFKCHVNNKWKTIPQGNPISTKKGDKILIRYNATIKVKDTVNVASLKFKGAFWVLRKFYLVGFDLKYGARRRILKTDLI